MRYYIEADLDNKLLNTIVALLWLTALKILALESDDDLWHFVFHDIVLEGLHWFARLAGSIDSGAASDTVLAIQCSNDVYISSSTCLLELYIFKLDLN